MIVKNGYFSSVSKSHHNKNEAPYGIWCLNFEAPLNISLIVSNTNTPNQSEWCLIEVPWANWTIGQLGNWKLGKFQDGDANKGDLI